MQEHNNVLLDKFNLQSVLSDLSRRLFQQFGTTIRLVVHGGAVMVLHPSLSCRKNTRDVDYCHRAFVTEWRNVPDAGDKLNRCIEATARKHGLGADWMNAHADVALPMAQDAYGQLTDPIYNDAMSPTNVSTNTIFSSPGLVLIGVTWSWAVALKLVRYQKDDPTDIAAILSLGTQMQGLQWTRQLLEDWLHGHCGPMGYSQYPMDMINQTRAKMRDAIKRAQALPWGPSPPPALRQQPPTLVSASALQLQNTAMARPSTAVPPSLASSSHDWHRRDLDLDPGRKTTARARTRSVTAMSAPAPAAVPPPVPALPSVSSMQQPWAPHPTRHRLSPSHAHPSAHTMQPIYFAPTPVRELPPGFVPNFVVHNGMQLHPAMTRVAMA